MFDLKVCVACLDAGSKMYNMDEWGIRSDFNAVACLKSSPGNGLPSYLCFQCYAFVKKFKKFQNKCQTSNYALNMLLVGNLELTLNNIESLNRESLGLKSSLSFLKSENVHFKVSKFHWMRVYGPAPVKVNEELFIFSLPVTGQADEPMRTEYCEIEVDMSVDNKVDEPPITSYEQPPYDLAEPNAAEVEVEIDDSNVNNYDSDTNTVVDGMTIENFEADIIELNTSEQMAVVEVQRNRSIGKHRCEICNQGYKHEKSVKTHMRMHDKHTSGLYCCDICNYYYKTQFLLTTHVEQKHLFKYVCRICNDVNYTRSSAKSHFLLTHCKEETELSSYTNRRNAKIHSKIKSSPWGHRICKFPEDFLIYSPISHLEQYQIIADRKNSKNYIRSPFKCELCFRGFREFQSFANHQKKHDPQVSGPLQCDVCKMQFQNSRKMYKHMILSHIYKYTCQLCDFQCFNKTVAQMHYRWHNNVTYPCQHCDMVFTKSSTRLTHIRIKHPSTAICNICGHSFVSDVGLYFHKMKVHTKEDISNYEMQVQNGADPELHCSECNVQFITQQAFQVHLGSSSNHVEVNLSVQQPSRNRPPKHPGESNKRTRKPRSQNEIHNNGTVTTTTCEECGLVLPNDVQARKHYKTEHPGTKFLKRYMCDVCGHTTQQYNNLLVHMRKHTQEKPFACSYCDRRFSMPSNRDRHLVVHTGEKRYECEYCQRRFSQNSALKLHIQTVHLKIPYAPWDKKNRKRRKAMELNTPQPEPKLHTHGEYLNAYISYHDE